MKRFSLLAFALALTSTAFADTYRVDPKASTVEWKGTKKIGSFHNGGISVREGSLVTNAKNELQSGSVSIDMKTITNEDLKEKPDYQKKLVGHLSSADFFDVAKYPTATLKILSVAHTGGDNVRVKAELTMIGKTGPIEFPAKVARAKDELHADATVMVDRTKWGLKYGSGSFFKELTADKIISDEFELKVKLVAKKSK